MKLLFLLSGEHETLPPAEVLSVFESMDIKYRVLDQFEQVLVADVKLGTGGLRKIASRLGMTHAICELLGSCENREDKIIGLAESIDVAGKSFAVRVRRVKWHGERLSAAALERDIGGVVWEDGRASVDLKNPEEKILGIISEKFALGRVVAEVDRGQYEKRRPHKRPYFHPGAMLPRISRACVNLSRLSPGQRFLDPFSGTGGFLIEAGLMGAEVYGCDIDDEAVEGCKKNLELYKIDGKVEVNDALLLECDRPFDAIATDPPYGISASTKGLGLLELYKKSLNSIFRVLKDDGYACIVGPERVPMEQVAEDAGFKIEGVHLERVHRSLTRRILVLKK